MDLEKDELRTGPKLRGPRTQKDFKVFEKLCEIQCTVEEVAAAFDCHWQTLAARVEEKYGDKFSQVYKAKRALGRKSLRRAQWDNAIEGKNTQMQIHLGKNVLGQSDKIHHTEEVADPEISEDELADELAKQLDTLSRSVDGSPSGSVKEKGSVKAPTKKKKSARKK